MNTTNMVKGKAHALFRSSLRPLLVLLVGIPASIIFYVVVQNSVVHVAQLQFDREADAANSLLENRLHSYTHVLYALRAQFASEDSVDRIRFHRFVKSLDIQRRYPGFIALNYAAYVLAEDKKRFEAAVRADSSMQQGGYPNFSIKPPGERPEYFVLLYIEPMAGYEFAMGLDIAANPMAKDPEKVATAIRMHRDTGNLSASAQPLRIMRGKEVIYLAMRLGVYKREMPVDTIAQRREAYIGSVGAAFDIESLIKAALDRDALRHIRCRLYDVGITPNQRTSNFPEERRLLFDTQNVPGRPPQFVTDDLETTFVYKERIEIADRIWEFEYSAPRHTIISDRDKFLAPLALGAGLLMSFLIFGVVYTLATSRSRAITIANEITKDLRDSEEALKTYHEQLQALSRRLVDIQEIERRRFSSELHDVVGQNLTALSINLDIIKSQVSGSQNTALQMRLNDSAELLQSTTDTIENVMSELRPPMLDDFGLLSALQWYANQFSTRTGIQVEVLGDERMERMTPASEIALFRVAQEALNNVVKHAHAKCVDIRLKRRDGQCVMSVSDDGTGFDAVSLSASRRRPGLGMVTMRERMQAIGGVCEVEAAPGHGTRVELRAPC